MILEINSEITEDHFKGCFEFPNDLDFIGESTGVQFFADSFNEMIKIRLSKNNIQDTLQK
jgi:c-di-AMP phosphodiesterase-like protein